MAQLTDNLEEVIRTFYELEDNQKLATALLNDYHSYSKSVHADQPIRCQGHVRQWDDVQRGAIVDEVQLAHNYYMDPRNPNGTFAERRALLDRTIKEAFTKFVNERTSEYSSVRCTYRGIDWNTRGSSWKYLVCQPGFRFVRESLDHTTNGDWKGGPVWENGDTVMGWKTGGHGRSDTFAQLDAVYADIPQRVMDELNSARAILHDRGIPTTWNDLS